MSVELITFFLVYGAVEGADVALMSMGGYGHLNPLTSVGRILHDRGHLVKYVLPDAWYFEYHLLDL